MADPARSRLYLRPAGLRRLREHVEAAWPIEACGLLEGHAIGPNAHVERVIPCRNEHERPERHYRIDPESFLRADRAAAAIGRAIVGVWHSHPDGRACFSDTDRAQAWPDWHYLVAAVDNASMRTLCCWHIRADGPTPGRVLVHG